MALGSNKRDSSWSLSCRGLAFEQPNQYSTSSRKASSTDLSHSSSRELRRNPLRGQFFIHQDGIQLPAICTTRRTRHPQPSPPLEIAYCFLPPSCSLRNFLCRVSNHILNLADPIRARNEVGLVRTAGVDRGGVVGGSGLAGTGGSVVDTAKQGTEDAHGELCDQGQSLLELRGVLRGDQRSVRRPDGQQWCRIRRQPLCLMCC